MTQELAAAMMIALALLLLGLAWRGWRNRRKRFDYLEGALIRSLPASPALLSGEGLYVATTVADQPMNRVPVGPLSFRAKARFSIHPEGVVLAPQGESPILMDARRGMEAGRATWTIDRVVEPDGLVMLRWNLGDMEVDSYLRIVESDASRVIETVNSLKGSSE